MTTAQLLAHNIKRLREQKGISDAGEIERTLLNPHTIEMIESGYVSLSFKLLDYLCFALDCHPHELFLPPDFWDAFDVVDGR